MSTLELKIPPPAVAALIFGAMWIVSSLAPSIPIPPLVRELSAAIIALVGVTFGITATISFRHARTTINPLRPGATTALVQSGIFRCSRNPMYLGLAIVLVAWAVFLSSAWAVLGPPGFVMYMNRFQIGPEERVLAGLFGADYSAYKALVRRWL